MYSGFEHKKCMVTLNMCCENEFACHHPLLVNLGIVPSLNKQTLKKISGCHKEYANVYVA